MLNSRFDRGQRMHRGPVDHRPVRHELRPMAGAVPAFFEAVPMDDAAGVSADRAAFGEFAVFVAVDRVLGNTVPDNGSLAPGD